ncbi:MAG: carbamoyl-phosphate synthase large subunit, partial [Candidatus Nanohaloarchaea archaeon]|nr:carbamoyl-phosphate synthase large subunit [Candidatus Nanohaloarchaea archaeon]
MPTRDDLDKIMLIGSGPIRIGQAAEFDYSGSQACKSLQEEGMEVVLVNSNPATIMTDPQMADRVYIEPLTVDALKQIIEKEQPDGIAAGLGGQTALNMTSELAEAGVLEEHDVEVLGCSLDTIETTEDRELFKEAMEEVGEQVAKSRPVSSVKEAEVFAEETGYPLLVRPAYTLGGTGGGVAHGPDELEETVRKGINASRINQVLLDEYLDGWKEFEYEIMRDGNDTAITVVNMENIDPLGVHTGDSAVVTPSQTLTDEEHHRLRTAAHKIIRHLDIEGGCNIQFTVNPDNGEYRVIEVNPRVSRSSALASKATGYPIARVAAKISVGKNLHEIENDITKETPASFEPMIDYTVVKIPRWPFEKLHGVEDSLTTQMKGTGEAMAIGRTLEEALQKAVRSLDLSTIDNFTEIDYEGMIDEPNSLRLIALYSAFRDGATVEELADRTGIDPFFLQKIANIVEAEEDLDTAPDAVDAAKKEGFTDGQIAEATDSSVAEVRDVREAHDILPTYKMVDTCAGEFEATTPF